MNTNLQLRSPEYVRQKDEEKKRRRKRRRRTHAIAKCCAFHTNAKKNTVLSAMALQRTFNKT